MRANGFPSTIDEQSANVKPLAGIQQEVLLVDKTIKEEVNIGLGLFALRSHQQDEMQKVDEKNSLLTKLFPSGSNSTSSDMKFEKEPEKFEPAGEIKEQDSSELGDQKPNMVWNPYSLRVRQEVKLEPVISRRRIKAESDSNHQRLEKPKAKYVKLVKPKKFRANGIKTEFKLNDKVFARVHHCPPWPGKIVNVLPRSTYKVVFYGSAPCWNNVLADNIYPYDETTIERFTSTSIRASLKASFSIALDQIHSDIA